MIKHSGGMDHRESHTIGPRLGSRLSKALTVRIRDVTDEQELKPSGYRGLKRGDLLRSGG